MLNLCFPILSNLSWFDIHGTDCFIANFKIYDYNWGYVAKPSTTIPDIPEVWNIIRVDFKITERWIDDYLTDLYFTLGGTKVSLVPYWGSIKEYSIPFTCSNPSINTFYLYGSSYSPEYPPTIMGYAGQVRFVYPFTVSKFI